MEKITSRQIRLIHALLHAYARMRGYPIEPDEKKQFILSCTNGRAASTRQLTADEGQQVVDKIWDLIHELNTFQQADRQRKLIIHFAHLMGWQKPNGQADMQRINEYCIKYGYLHKPLMQYTSTELVKLVQQFQLMYLAYLKK